MRVLSFKDAILQIASVSARLRHFLLFEHDEYILVVARLLRARSAPFSADLERENER